MWNLATYQTPAVVKAVGGYISQGCWTEGEGGRALGKASYTDTKNMTVEGCVGFCRGKGLKWAGVEYAQE